MTSSSFLRQLAQELWEIRHVKPQPLTEADIQTIISELDPPVEELHASTLQTLPSKSVFTELTTARNRNLITSTEQQKLQNTIVTFFGLSVGSHSALTWMMTSRADSIKIVDPDTIAASNLNRLRFGWDSIGQRKIDVVKRELEQINPYARIIATDFTDYPTTAHLFTDNPATQIVVDAIDNMESKLWLRQLCRRYKTPLISAADVGDMVMLDIERHDLDSNTPFFHNLIPNIESINFSQLSPLQKKALIIQLVGFEHNSEKMLESIKALGKTLPTWPQLGATATMAGGIVANTIKKIILEEQVLSGRYYLSLDELLDSSFNSSDRQHKRATLVQEITS